MNDALDFYVAVVGAFLLTILVLALAALIVAGFWYLFKGDK